MGDEVTAGDQIRPGLFAAFHCLHLNGPEIDFAWPRPFAVIVLTVFRVDCLYLFRRNVLGDRQVSGEAGVPVLLVDRFVGGQAADVDVQLLETVTSTQLLERLGMAVIEMLVADEDVIENKSVNNYNK